MLYRVEHRIAALSAMTIVRDGRIAEYFDAEGVRFSPWDLSPEGRYRADFWLAEAEIDAGHLIDALERYWPRVARIVPRLSLVTQAYIEGTMQPFLFVSDVAAIGYLRYTKHADAVGLYLGVEELDAMNELLHDTTIPNEFFYYWNEAVATAGYTAKI